MRTEGWELTYFRVMGGRRGLVVVQVPKGGQGSCRAEGHMHGAGAHCAGGPQPGLAAAPLAAQSCKHSTLLEMRLVVGKTSVWTVAQWLMLAARSHTVRLHSLQYIPGSPNVLATQA